MVRDQPVEQRLELVVEVVEELLEQELREHRQLVDQGALELLASMLMDQLIQ